MTTPQHAGPDERSELLVKALRRAFALGQTYWQQADSEYIRHHVKADETLAKFSAFIDETVSALLAEDKGWEVVAVFDSTALEKAMTLASLLAGSVGMSDVSGSNGYRNDLRDHLSQYVSHPQQQQAAQAAVPQGDIENNHLHVQMALNDWRAMLMGLCVGKEEAYTPAQAHAHVKGRIDRYKAEIDRLKRAMLSAAPGAAPVEQKGEA